MHYACVKSKLTDHILFIRHRRGRVLACSRIASAIAIRRDAAAHGMSELLVLYHNHDTIRTITLTLPKGRKPGGH